MVNQIVNLGYGEKEIAVRIIQPGCDGGQLIDYKNLQLMICAPDCGYLLKSPIIMKGCHPGNFYRNPPDPRQLPRLYYPAIKTDLKGRTVFRLDDKFEQYPAGCYIGQVQFKNGQVVCDIDLRLHTTPFIIDEIEIITPEPKRRPCA